MGSIEADVGARIARQMDEFAKNITSRLGTIKSPQSARAMRELRKIIRAQRELLLSGHTRAIVAGRAYSFRESLKVWEKGGREFAKLKGLSDIEISSIRPVSVSMVGAFENLRPGPLWQSVVRNSAVNMAEMAESVVSQGLLEGVDPDELARRLRRYVKGSESFAGAFRQVPTISGEKLVIDLRRGMPANLRDAAKKMKFNSTRIAFSEIHNARAEAEIQHFIEDPYVGAVRWRLSPNRGTLQGPDECDVLATQDAYGLGKGVYPVTEVPVPPHPFDRCERDPVTRATSEIKKPKPKPKLKLDPRDTKMKFPRASKLTAGAQTRARKSAWEAMRIGGAQPIPPLTPAMVGGVDPATIARLEKKWAAEVDTLVADNKRMGWGDRARKTNALRVTSNIKAMRRGQFIDVGGSTRTGLVTIKEKIMVEEIVTAFKVTPERARRMLDEWRGLTHRWTVGSETLEAGVVKHLAEREFGAHTIYHKKFIDSKAELRKKFLASTGDDIDTMVRRLGVTTVEDLQYFMRLERDMTVSMFKHFGRDTVTVYRGTGKGYFRRNNIPMPKVGDAGIAAHNSLASWSTSQPMAEKFGSVIYRAEVKTTDVFWNFWSSPVGQGKEREFVLIGRSIPYKVVKVKP